MSWDEIEIPKEVRHFMLKDVNETVLGQKNGAKKQYRYGNLHIREYDDKYLVHMDKVDPRQDPIGHLIHDAPEILIGVANGIIVGRKIASTFNKLKHAEPHAKDTSIFAGLLASLIVGYTSYSLIKKLKEI